MCDKLFLWHLLVKLHLDLLQSVDQQKSDRKESIINTFSPSAPCSRERGEIRETV